MRGARVRGAVRGCAVHSSYNMCVMVGPHIGLITCVSLPGCARSVLRSLPGLITSFFRRCTDPEVLRIQIVLFLRSRVAHIFPRLPTRCDRLDFLFGLIRCVQSSPCPRGSRFARRVPRWRNRLIDGTAWSGHTSRAVRGRRFLSSPER